jgi:hypothetical protein
MHKGTLVTSSCCHPHKHVTNSQFTCMPWPSFYPWDWKWNLAHKGPNIWASGQCGACLPPHSHSLVVFTLNNIEFNFWIFEFLKINCAEILMKLGICKSLTIKFDQQTLKVQGPSQSKLWLFFITINRVICKETLSSPPIRKLKTFLINLSMKSWYSAFNAQGSQTNYSRCTVRSSQSMYM